MNAVNLRCRTRAADLASELVGRDLADVPVCVLGAAFKPYSDDVRDSPALDVARILHGLGAQVTVYDPAALGSARRVCPELDYAESTTEAAKDAQVVLMLTEWPEFTRLDPDSLASVVARRNIIDGRHALDPAAWRQAGWNYRALGTAQDALRLRRSATAAVRYQRQRTANLAGSEQPGRLRKAPAERGPSRCAGDPL
jgi:UDPglucose 6-dehydrogenase